MKNTAVTEGNGQAEVVAPAPNDIQAHLRIGKARFDEGLYIEALNEFAEIITVAPGNIETRVWIRKVKEAMKTPQTRTNDKEAEENKGNAKECLWMKLGMVSYRNCTNSYNCVACDFDQQMQEKMAKGDTEEVELTLRKFEALPGIERICRYALKGDVSFRICTRGFQCATCEFDQEIEDVIQKKLAKLANRRDVMRHK